MNEDNLDLYEKREHEVLEKLGQMELTDPHRKDLTAELSAYSTIRNAYETTEQKRLENNAKNDIKEETLRIQVEKAKVEKQKMILGAAQFVVGIVIGGVFQMKSYHMDEKGFSFKGLKNLGEKITERITFFGTIGK